MDRPISKSLEEWEAQKRAEKPLPPNLQQLKLFIPPHQERIYPMNDKQRRHHVRILAEKAIAAYQAGDIDEARKAHNGAMDAMKDPKDLPVYIKTKLADWAKKHPMMPTPIARAAESMQEALRGDREAVA